MRALVVLPLLASCATSTPPGKPAPVTAAAASSTAPPASAASPPKATADATPPVALTPPAAASPPTTSPAELHDPPFTPPPLPKKTIVDGMAVMKPVMRRCVTERGRPGGMWVMAVTLFGDGHAHGDGIVEPRTSDPATNECILAGANDVLRFPSFDGPPFQLHWPMIVR